MSGQNINLETANPRCKQCGNTYSFLQAVKTYGVFFLIGKTEGYFGTSCAVCGKTNSLESTTSYLTSLKQKLTQALQEENQRLKAELEELKK